LLGRTLIMKYGYIYNIQDTPSGNFWTQSREIELLDGSIVYGCEGNFEIEEGKGQMFTRQNFITWLEENRKQKNQ